MGGVNSEWLVRHSGREGRSEASETIGWDAFASVVDSGGITSAETRETSVFWLDLRESLFGDGLSGVHPVQVLLLVHEIELEIEHAGRTRGDLAGCGLPQSRHVDLGIPEAHKKEIKSASGNRWCTDDSYSEIGESWGAADSIRLRIVEELNSSGGIVGTNLSPWVSGHDVR